MSGASLPNGATLRFPASMCCFGINKFQFSKRKEVQSAAKPASVLETLMGNVQKRGTVMESTGSATQRREEALFFKCIHSKSGETGNDTMFLMAPWR